MRRNQSVILFPYLENVINIRHYVDTKALVVIVIELQLLYTLSS